MKQLFHMSVCLTLQYNTTYTLLDLTLQEYVIVPDIKNIDKVLLARVYNWKMSHINKGFIQFKHIVACQAHLALVFLPMFAIDKL